MDDTRRRELRQHINDRPSPIPTVLDGLPTGAYCLVQGSHPGWDVTLCVDGVLCIQRQRSRDWYRHTMLGPCLPPMEKDLDLKTELPEADSDPA